MKKYFKSAIAMLTTSLIFLAGCGNNSTKDEKTQTTTNKEYDICIYNSDTSIGKSFREMCDEYTKRTGVIIRTITPTEEESTIENLENYMNSEYPPDIFTVGNMQELDKWQKSENIWDFSNATEEDFKNMVNSIPETLRLSSNMSNSFGVPATLNGYGYIVDPKMISSLFGGEIYRKALYDLQRCSYAEFIEFLDAVALYIGTGECIEFNLNEKKYSFLTEKGELSKNLNGIFSFAAGDPKISGSYFMNHILASLFKSPAAAAIASENQIDSLSSPLMRLTEQLDLITYVVASENSVWDRGEDFISTTKNSATQAIKNFVAGKSLFLLGSTHDYNNVNIFDYLVANRCVFIPMKTPVTEIDISLSGIEFNKDLDKSLTVYAPNYYCINAKSSDIEKKAAQDFLVWLRTSELAAKYVISEFKYVPYNIQDGSVLDNPLEKSMVEYLKENSFIPAVFMGAPNGWCNDIMGKHIVEKLFTKAPWTLDDYEELADYGVAKWKELKNT